MEFIANFVPTGILFLIIIGFGIWNSRVGKPYNGLLFNIHKLIALGAVILTGLRIWRMNPFGEFPSLVIILLAVDVVCVITTFATGAIMSIKDQESRIVLAIHQLAPVLIAISAVGILFLLI
jgi:hypothetical protein